ncbi:MAG: hypothetical protein RPR97_02625 [Colwellia sp.]
MKIINNAFTLLSIILLTSCSNGTHETTVNEQAILLPKVTNACYKIKALINEYENGFNKIKSGIINTRVSRIWKAKYNLVGDNCQVWSWGKNRHTYSCSNTVPTKEIADYYFQNAKNTAKNCLGTEWTVKESARKNDNGYKIEFNNKTSDLMLAAHAVPTANLFKSEWTIYYYIGSASQAE